MSPRARGTGSTWQPRYRSRTGEQRTAATWSMQWYDRRKHGYVREHGFASEAKAEKALRQRLAAQERGEVAGPSIERTTFAALVKLIEDDYAANGRRLPRLRQTLAHLRAWFGEDRAVDVTAARVLAYRAARLEAAKPATVNREQAALKRAFVLGERSGLVAHRPHVEMLAEDNVRKGFFEEHQFRAVLARLPDYVQPVAQVAYVTGWRVPSEILTREWRHVDFAGGWLRLEPGEAKAEKPRLFPLDPQLRPVLEALRARTTALEREHGRVIPWIFYRVTKAGRVRRLGSLYKAWHAACRAAGISGRIPHDFRRTALRNLTRASVSLLVAMELVGWASFAMVKRYGITDEQLLREAAAKLGAVSR